MSDQRETPRWWLRCPNGDAPLGERELLIGRDMGCHLRFDDDPLVSRIHARVLLDQGRVVLEDLGSTNGTFVDEQRITGRRELAAGSRVRIGGQLFWLHSGVQAPRGPRNVTTSAEIPRYKKRPPEAPELDTNAASIFAILGESAEAALAAGQLDEVRRILEPHLDELLASARRGKPLDPAVVAEAYRFALKLARATGHGAWVDYVVELASAHRGSLPPEVRQELPDVVAAVDVVTLDWRALAQR